MKANEELLKKYWSLFGEEIKEEIVKEEATKTIELHPARKREFKPIMTEEEFDKIFGSLE
jgi:hypothetical protein